MWHSGFLFFFSLPPKKCTATKLWSYGIENLLSSEDGVVAKILEAEVLTTTSLWSCGFNMKNCNSCCVGFKFWIEILVPWRRKEQYPSSLSLSLCVCGSLSLFWCSYVIPRKWEIVRQIVVARGNSGGLCTRCWEGSICCSGYCCWWSHSYCRSGCCTSSTCLSAKGWFNPFTITSPCCSVITHTSCDIVGFRV